MDLHRLSPYIRHASESTVQGPYLLKEREIFDYDLVYIKDGCVNVIINGNKYIGNSGDIFLFKPKQRHSLYIEDGTYFNQLYVHFDLYYLDDSPEVKISFSPIEKMSPKELSWFREDVCSKKPFNLPNYIRLQNPIYVQEMLQNIIQEFKTKTIFYETVVKGLFIQVLTYLLRQVNWSEHCNTNIHYSKLVEIASFINTNYDRNFTDDELAKMINISKNYFISIFSNTFGLTPKNYHTMVRMEKAKELIQFTTLTIEQIAEKVGYSGIHSFSRAFKNYEGVHPTYYRNRI